MEMSADAISGGRDSANPAYPPTSGRIKDDCDACIGIEH